MDPGRGRLESSRRGTWAQTIPPRVCLPGPPQPGCRRHGRGRKSGSRLDLTLERLFPAGDEGWERELTWFLDEAISSTHNPAEAEMVEAAVLSLAQCHVARGEQQTAREVLRARIHELHDLPAPHTPIEVTLLLARMEASLGDADAAERHLRSLRESPAPGPARAALELGAMAVERQEPWAESLLREAIAALAPPRIGPDVCIRPPARLDPASQNATSSATARRPPRRR